MEICVNNLGHKKLPWTTANGKSLNIVLLCVFLFTSISTKKKKQTNRKTVCGHDYEVSVIISCIKVGLGS